VVRWRDYLRPHYTQPGYGDEVDNEEEEEDDDDDWYVK
jgi:hypothetical protein